MSHQPQCSPMQLIHLRLRIGWRKCWRCSPPHSAAIERRSCMLQDDFRGQPLLGGMHMLMFRLCYHLGWIRCQLPEPSHTSRTYEDEEEGVSVPQAGQECEWLSMETSSLSCHAMPLRKLLIMVRSRRCS
jgi:hypothetical protein